MSRRMRTVVLSLVAFALLTPAGVYLGYLRLARATAPAHSVSGGALDPSAVLARPHIVFRSVALGPDYGRLGVVPVADPQGQRALLDLSCERVYATARAGACVTSQRGLAQTYAIAVLDSQLRPVSSVSLKGLPSRVRMSADGAMVATTTFVTGHSYEQTSFSTETLVRRNQGPVANLENFSTFVDGRELLADDRNVWGVTFAADGDTFYATASSGKKTWLMKGSFDHRRMESQRPDAECPSLSPDGTKIAYKKRLESTVPGAWRLAVLDLRSGRETSLAESRSVDDQVEWLDENNVLYGMQRSGSDATISDVWVVPADGGGAPSVLISQASSPAVVIR